MVLFAPAARRKSLFPGTYVGESGAAVPGKQDTNEYSFEHLASVVVPNALHYCTTLIVREFCD
jgi:hypothetical protein